MDKVIITGANGFAGSALCQELTSSGICVTAVVRNQKSDISGISHLPHLNIVYSDMSDIGSLIEILDRDYDVFYHFAWEGCSGLLRSCVDIQLKNVRYTCEAVRTAAALGCRKFIYASSIMEYEIDHTVQMQQCPGINTVYCTAKKTAGYMAHAIAGQCGISYISGLISNIYGPGENSPRLINASVRKLLEQKPVEFTAGNQMYDFIYITDAARYFHAIGEKGKADAIYYIGSGSPRPLKEFLFEMGETVSPGVELGIGKIPYDGDGLTYKEFDILKTQRDLGVHAQIPFSEGIRRTAEWMIQGGILDESV